MLCDRFACSLVPLTAPPLFVPSGMRRYHDRELYMLSSCSARSVWRESRFVSPPNYSDTSRHSARYKNARTHRAREQCTDLIDWRPFYRYITSTSVNVITRQTRVTY